MSSDQKGSKILFYQVAVLYGWVLLTIATLAMYFALSSSGDASFTESRGSLTKVMALLVPQLTLMCVFFFSGKEEEITRNKHLGICLSLTFVYQTCFLFFLYWGVYMRNFGPDKYLEENTDAFVTYIGYLSVLGVAPLGYLFSTSGFTNKEPENKKPSTQSEPNG